MFTRSPLLRRREEPYAYEGYSFRREYPTLHQSDTASECSDSPVARQQHWSTYFAHVDPCMEILRYWENDCLGEALSRIFRQKVAKFDVSPVYQ